VKRTDVRVRASQRTCVLILTILLCLVSVHTGMSLQQTNRVITSSGTINYEDYLVTIKVGFENPEDFERPEDPATGYVFAGQTSWSATELNNDNGARVVEPATDIAHSGNQSMKLQLAGPFDADKDRRIHIYHQWETAAYKHIWFEQWIYIPADFVVDKWTTIHAAFSERWFYSPTGYQNFGMGLALTPTSKVTVGEYKLEAMTNYGWVDNNGDGKNDLPPLDLRKDWYWSNGTIKFGEWTKLTTYVYRDMDPTKGIFKVWINDVLQTMKNARGEILNQCRTVGIDPVTIDSKPKTGGWERAWVESGLSLYSGDLPTKRTDTWTGDGTTTSFTTARTPIIPDSEKVYVNQTLMIKGVDYTIDYATGAITFTTAPGASMQVEATYTYGTPMSPKEIRVDDVVFKHENQTYAP